VLKARDRRRYGLGGPFLDPSSSGLIGAATLFYPTARRSTGVGWAMGMGRLGSFLGPPGVRVMAGSGWDLVVTYAAVGAPALVAAVCPMGLGWVQRGADRPAVGAGVR
jgi:MFS transporter, AAHS family, 4-hydroxybenzoate transporter